MALAGANVDSVISALSGAARDFAGGSLLLGVSLLVVSLITVLRGTVMPETFSGISIEEVANYVTERFVHEPDLWRVQLRTVHGFLELVELATERGERSERSLRKAEYSLFPASLRSGSPSLP